MVIAAVTAVTAAVVTAGDPSTTSSSTTSSTTAASRANLTILCTVRQRIEQMCTLEGNKVYSTKYSRFRSSPTDISYCTL